MHSVIALFDLEEGVNRGETSHYNTILPQKSELNLKIQIQLIMRRTEYINATQSMSEFKYILNQ